AAAGGDRRHHPRAAARRHRSGGGGAALDRRDADAVDRVSVSRGQLAASRREIAVKILYFAWLRERLNRSEEVIELPPEVSTVSDLLHFLSNRDEAYALAFEKRNRIRAAIDT